jgi:predicted house-cleaning noncanonical NTP pyrophosphatase (MazG superfamily)
MSYMKFRTFKQHKLVRDKILNLMQEQGSKLYAMQLSDKDFQKQLKIKLVEEALEVQHANNKENITEELADVLEVVHALANAHDINFKDVEAAQKLKREVKGSFASRTFVTFAEHPVDSPAERYCLADPEKYPEVKN